MAELAQAAQTDTGAIYDDHAALNPLKSNKSNPRKGYFQ